MIQYCLYDQLLWLVFGSRIHTIYGLYPLTEGGMYFPAMQKKKKDLTSMMYKIKVQCKEMYSHIFLAKIPWKQRTIYYQY